MNILIVEDCEDIREFMKFMIEGYGYEVSVAADGRQAIERAGEVYPDLILMDISMPVLDGLAATRTIRQLDCCREIPIVAVTAFGDEYYTEAVSAGCSGLIAKPLDFENLRPLLDHYLHQPNVT